MVPEPEAESDTRKPEPAPVAEALLLARALSAHVHRAAARGLRRVPGASLSTAPAVALAVTTGVSGSTGPTRPTGPTGPTGGALSTGPARTAEDVRLQAAAAGDLASLRAAVAACTACGLCATRKQTVFMDGRGTARVLFVGEAPGADEDRTGVPFVGRAGQLLTDIIEKGMRLAREEVYIANVIKCRPPENRDPTRLEKATCTPWLDRQIELMDPQVIIPLGRHAAMHILKTEASMGSMRGRVHESGGRTIVPTFHPAYLLRSPGEKKECWKDIQRAMEVLGLKAR